MDQKTKGFTLMELLVVVAIIGILMAIGFASFASVQKRGRDARRKSDIKAIQSAFEQYYGENESYHSNCATMASGYLQGGLITSGPKGEAYTSTTCTNSGYCFCASLEIDGSGNSGASCTFTASTQDYFCVSNLQ